MMNCRMYKWHGVEYTKWYCNATNYVAYDVTYKHKVYNFYDIESVHDFIRSIV